MDEINNVNQLVINNTNDTMSSIHIILTVFAVFAVIGFGFYLIKHYSKN